MFTLDTKLIPTYHVSFLTYAGGRESGSVGLDAFIAQCYGLAKDFEMTESPNDTDYGVTVEKKPLDKWDRVTADKAAQEGWVENYKLGVVLCDLCNKGFIEPGEYMVTMSW